MLKVPAKYGRCGIKVKCLHCKHNANAKCGKTGKSIKSCEHKDKHRFNLIVCVPKNPGVRKTRILETRNFNDALIELSKFKEELKKQGYHKLKVKKQIPQTTLTYFITTYLDALSGVNTLAILVRKRSKDHVNHIVLTFERFRASLKKAGYNFNSLDAKDIKDEEVNVFHEYLLNDLKLGNSSYNKAMTIMRTLYNWVDRVKDYKIPNPFNHLKLHATKKDVSLITKEEFENFLAAITRENSYNEKAKKYMYRDFLVPIYRLALETGLRREELLTLRWSDIIPIDNGKLVCRISNLKVNRIMGKQGSDMRMKYIPVTKGLLNLLMDLGYKTKEGSHGYIIERPEQELSQAMDLLSRCFTHFIKFATKRKLEFGCLRKTYITRLTMAAGPNARVFTGHTSDETLQNHYLAKAFMAANLEDFTVL